MIDTDPAAENMDRMYRYQRHFYDLTREYYLLGRDHLLSNLNPPHGANVLEVGCGTGRNLIHAAHLYPRCNFFGCDISLEMLKTAGSSLQRHGLTDRIKLVQGDATSLSSHNLLSRTRFERIYICYSLSMIPEWARAINEALNLLEQEGELHIVDFGQSENLPGLFRSSLFKWLSLFDVNPRKSLAAELGILAQKGGRSASTLKLYRGYATYSIARPITKVSH